MGLRWRFFLRQDDFDPCEPYCPAAAVAGDPQSMDCQDLTAGARRRMLALSLIWRLGLEPNLESMADGAPLWAIREATAWLEVPIMLFGPEGGEIYPLLLGLLPHEGIVIEQGFLDPGAQSAAKEALDLALARHPGQGLVLLRRAQAPRGQPITGHSLMLPLAVGACNLLDAACDPQRLFELNLHCDRIMLTGGLDGNGSILPVGGIDSKLRAARLRANSFLLYPSAASDTEIDTDHACPVSTLDQALAMWRLLFDDTRDRALLLTALGEGRHDLASLFATLGERPQIPIRALLGVARTEGWSFGSSAGMVSSIKALHRLYSSDPRPPYLSDLMADLLSFFPFEKMEALEDPYPQMLVASMNVAVETLGGGLDSKWSVLAGKLFPSMLEMLVARIPAEEKQSILHLESHLLNLEHNSYRFGREQDGDWKRRFVNDLDFNLSCNDANSVLARLCGALCQHKALQGRLEEALEYAGYSERLSDDQDNLKRRHTDRIYINCDLGRLDDAERSLMRLLSLEREGQGDVEPVGAAMSGVSSIFTHNAFLRLCLKRPCLFEGYDARAQLAGVKSREASGRQVSEPWQTVLTNLGCLMAPADPSGALECLTLALGICKMRGGTLLPMALRPLASMRRLGLGERQWIESETDDVITCLRGLCGSGKISGEHFALVLGAQTAAAALDEVDHHESELFPFNFR